MDTFDIPTERYDLILNTLYLNRPLFPHIREGLRPGGMLIFETLLDMPGGAGHAEHCRDYFLKPNELLHRFLSLRVLLVKVPFARDVFVLCKSLFLVPAENHGRGRG